MKWIRTVTEKLPRFNVFMDFIAVSGLKLVEAVNSYNLIVELAKEGKLSEYYDVEKQSLEHFRFKEIFAGNNKKALISFIPEQLVEKIFGKNKLTL